jgi:hypothetical protein
MFAKESLQAASAKSETTTLGKKIDDIRSIPLRMRWRAVAYKQMFRGCATATGSLMAASIDMAPNGLQHAHGSARGM